MALQCRSRTWSDSQWLLAVTPLELNGRFDDLLDDWTGTSLKPLLRNLTICLLLLRSELIVTIGALPVFGEDVRDEFEDLLDLISDDWVELDLPEIILDFVQNFCFSAQTRSEEFQMFDLLKQ